MQKGSPFTKHDERFVSSMLAFVAALCCAAVAAAIAGVLQ